MHRRLIGAATLLALSNLVVGCGADNELSGSISESFSLDFDRAEVRYLVTTSELTIQYLRDLGNTTSKPVKVVIDARDLPIGEDTRISGDVFLERVVIQREAETGGDFPEITGGTVVFDRINLALQEVEEEIDGRTVTYFTEPEGELEAKGEFDAVFENGRTLFGKFRAELRVDDPDAPVGE